mmetsp:Transcript_52516/g.150537  ORF Transcript_52516/g.150537 Transcript_52516/m.150537 type:complete len:285 (+) Transcript_52516:66-920(+)
MSAKMTDLQNLGFGMVCAPVFTFILQPTMYLKHARMQGLPLTWDPRCLWRGTAASICNETGQAGLQFLTTGLYKKLILGGASRHLTPLEDVSAASAAGATSALYVSPLESVTIQQQRFGGDMADTCRRMYRSFGLLSFGRGFVATALRDSVYVVGMMSATPCFEDRLTKSGLGATTGSLVGSCAAGVMAGVISCPFDCIKACMKGDFERRTYGTFTETARSLWRSGGAARPFHGVEWRCANLSGCFFIVALARRELEPYLLMGGTTDFSMESLPERMASAGVLR